MEEGVNILTSGYNVVVEGAEELVEKWNSGKISQEELQKQIMELETVMIDLEKVKEPTKFKDSEE
tara:strand:- start:981 stop:1175 length:195 start_codon:yes stop_codon:yes gene_type:complete